MEYKILFEAKLLYIDELKKCPFLIHHKTARNLIIDEISYYIHQKYKNDYLFGLVNNHLNEELLSIIKMMSILNKKEWLLELTEEENYQLNEIENFKFN